MRHTFFFPAFLLTGRDIYLPVSISDYAPRGEPVKHLE